MCKCRKVEAVHKGGTIWLEFTYFERSADRHSVPLNTFLFDICLDRTAYFPIMPCFSFPRQLSCYLSLPDEQPSEHACRIQARSRLPLEF
jgi:hypothetical protein